MIPYENPFEQEIALQAFTNRLDVEKGNLDRTRTSLTQAISAYRQAKKRHATLTALIQRLQSDSANASTAGVSESNDDTEPSPNPNLTNEPPVTQRAKMKLRDELVEIARSGNVIKETGDIIASVRASRGPTPKSSVAGALGDLSDAGILKRVRHLKPGTSYYGMPEWFDGDNPKPEHIPEQPLGIMTERQAREDDTKPKTAPVGAGAE